jgi:DNA-binding beta-propeller fold protein YncE
MLEKATARPSARQQGSALSSSARRLTLTFFVSALALAGVLAWSDANAQALLTHDYLSQLTGFGNPAAVTIDSSSDVLVADEAKQTVDRFGSAGQPLAFSANEPYIQGAKLSGTPSGPFAQPEGVAVDDAGGHIYVTDGGRAAVDVFAASGEYLFKIYGTLVKPEGLAVDQATHDLYVADAGSGTIDVFNAAGESISRFGAGTLSATYAESVAVNDLTEEAYVGDSGPVLLDVFDPSGTFMQPQWSGAGTPDGSFGQGRIYVGLNQTSGQVYVTDTDHRVVDEFASSSSESYEGQLRGTPSEAFKDPRAVAVDPSSGDLYVADGEADLVDVFGPDVEVPTAVTVAASNIGKATVKLNGTVDPEGIAVTSCAFEYGTTTAYGQSAPCAQTPAQIGGGHGPVSVDVELTGLQSGTLYHFRLRASNASGSDYANPETLTTPPAVEGVLTGPAESLSASTAKLTGVLSPNGSDAHYYFEYGTSASYGSTSPAPPGTDAGTASTSVPAQTTLSGLVANTTYHYRLVAVDAFGATDGEDRELTTAGAPQIRAESAEVESSRKAGQTTAALEGQIDPGDREASYHFEYGTTTAYGTKIPIPDGTLAAGEEFQSVPTAILSGLKLGSTYHYRLVASNEYGTVDGPDREFQTASAALVDQEYATEVTSASATLKAQVNPLGSDAHYYFQYGTSSNYSSSAPAPPGADAGAAESDVPLSVHLQALQPGTTYHYRIVLLGEPDGTPHTTAGPDRSFTTQAGPSDLTLPDGRAWEMVSPPNKQGAGLIALGYSQGSDIQAAVDGGGITYTANSPIEANPAGNRAIELTQIISTRHAPGDWESSDIATRHYEGAMIPKLGGEAEYKLFSSDLSLGYVEPFGDTPLPPLPSSAEPTVYLRNAGGAYEALVTTANVAPGVKFGAIEQGGLSYSRVSLESASPDLSHVVLYSQVPLLTGAPATGLYEWAKGHLKFVSVLPGGGTSEELYLGDGRNYRGAISNDGSRLVLSGGSADRGIYLRDTDREETLRISAAEGVSEPGGPIFRYMAADKDGSRIFFTSNARLTPDATASESKGTEDLYVFEVTSEAGQPLAGRLTDLSVDSNPGESAGVEAVLGAGEDGTDVYFLAGGVLGDGAEQGAAPAGRNLYFEHYDAATRSWTSPRFIAALGSGDELDAAEGFGTGKTSRVSPNGRYLTFMSERSLTGFDNRDANSDAPDEEVFLYDSSSGRLICPSCNPTGARPVGRFFASEQTLTDHGENWQGRWLAGNIPGLTTENLGTALYQSRYLGDSGRLFFNSAVALVPADVNGKEDVYEYEPAGIGSCQGPTYGQSASVVFSEAVGGCIALISSGTSSEESAFMDASETGGDVFFLTLSKLTPSDYDTSLDLYDAHECTTSSPCAPVPSATPPPCTTGDACKPAPTPQPTLFGSPSSETFSGAGNVAAPTPVAATPRSATLAQKLAKALKACRKKPKRRRASCKRQARSKYRAKRSSAAKSSSARTGR